MSERNSIVAKVFCDVLEKSVFMFGERVDANTLADQEGEFALASIRFTGQVAGTLEIAVPRAMCAEMAANMLGTEPGDEASTHQAEDTLKEILNVMCGNLLTVLAGDTAVFDLTIPQLASLSPEGWSRLARDSATLGFDVDGISAVLLRLDMMEKKQ